MQVKYFFFQKKKPFQKMAFSLKAEQECERDRRECKHMHTVKKRAEYKKKLQKSTMYT